LRARALRGVGGTATGERRTPTGRAMRPISRGSRHRPLILKRKSFRTMGRPQRH
jgi:hypothetical protein